MSEYLIVGGGAIGGTLALRLARAGRNVSIVDTDTDHVAAINENGLRVGNELIHVPARLPGDHTGQLKRVLLAVKAQATGAATDWIAPRLAEDGYVVSVQNGFNEAVLAARIGWRRTVSAFVNIFADVTAPGVIRDGGPGALVLGEPDGTVGPRVRALAAELDARVSENVAGFLWAKAGFGAMLAATALADAPMAELIERHPGAMHGIAAEVFTVAEALGIRLEPFDAFEPEAFTSGADATAALARLVAWLRTQPKDRSGIWRDLAVRSRPVEVGTHFTTVLEHADRFGIATPLLRRVLASLTELERDPSGMSEDRLTELEEPATH